MATMVMHAVVSLDGFIADANEGVGPLFEWYLNGDLTIVGASAERRHAPFRISQHSYKYVRSFWVASAPSGRHRFGAGRPIRPLESTRSWCLTDRSRMWHPEGELSDRDRRICTCDSSSRGLSERSRTRSGSPQMRVSRLLSRILADLREAVGSADDGPDAKYRDAHVWYDGPKPDNFTSYKLLIADMVDGELRVAAKRVMPAGYVMQGGRGGVDLPQGDIGRVRNHLAQYYSKSGEEPQWDR